MTWLLGADDHRRTSAALAGLADAAAGDRVEQPDLGDPAGIVVAHDCGEQLRTTVARCAAANVQVVVVAVVRLPDPWGVLAAGAQDVLTWDDDPHPIIERVRRLREIEQLVQAAASAQRVIGSSPALLAALRDLVTAARFGDGPILLLGETGTGKELAARVAHQVGASSPGNLVVVDCTTIVPTLSGSELFGHERGAFTGAVGARTGACAAADGGTLFLDEIGELSLELQPALLRLIQEGTYKRIGSDKWQHSRFRLICATNRSLGAEVEAGRFRADLYHRIAASSVTLPPLSARRDDIVPLFQAFFAEAAASTEPAAPASRSRKTRNALAATVELEAPVRTALHHRRYPGNLRDLRQLAIRVATRHIGTGPITPGDLPVSDRPSFTRDREPDPINNGLGTINDGLGTANDGLGTLDDGLADDGLVTAVRAEIRRGTTLRQLRERVCDVAVSVALDDSGGNVREAASRLGVTDRALHLRRAAAKPAT